MPLQIIHRDITTMDCDAIVNPTDNCFRAAVERTMRYTLRQASDFVMNATVLSRSASARLRQRADTNCRADT